MKAVDKFGRDVIIQMSNHSLIYNGKGADFKNQRPFWFVYAKRFPAKKTDCRLNRTPVLKKAKYLFAFCIGDDHMQYKSSPYRWVVLLSVFPILAVTQMFWLTFSAISPEAVSYYHTSALCIAFLSMSYMIVYVLLSIPASMLADRKGLRVSFAVGAIITGVFGMLRGIFYNNFNMIVLAQIGAAIAQPFLLNPITKLAAVWFPVNERATASGVASIAGYIGIIVAMVATPALYQAYSMSGMLKIYGLVSAAAAVLVLILLKKAPKFPAGPRGGVNDNFSFKESSLLWGNRNFMRLLAIVCIALGVFNALLTVLSDMLGARNFTAGQSGTLGGIIIISGLCGAVVIPMLSDRLKRRSIFLLGSVVFSLFGILGIVYLNQYAMLVISSMLAGFFLMGAGPLIFQFGTEVAYPIPEGTSYGLLMGSGQISGIIFIILLYLLRSPKGSMTLPMTLLIALMIFAAAASINVKESVVVREK